MLLGWPKKLAWVFFHKIWQKNRNELVGQPDISPNVSKIFTPLVVKIKVPTGYLALFFLYYLQSLVCISPFQHVSFQTSPNSKCLKATMWLVVFIWNSSFFFKKLFVWLCEVPAASYKICCAWAHSLQLSCPSARGILVPQPGIEPASLALEGWFLTTGPPGKSGNRAVLNPKYLLLVF